MKYVGAIAVLLFLVLMLFAFTKLTSITNTAPIVRWVPVNEVKTSSETQPYAFTQKNGKIFASYINDIPVTGASFPGADLNSFLVATEATSTGTPILLYAKDSTHVYWFVEGEEGMSIQIIPGVDPKTFQPLDVGKASYTFYSKDKNHVYNGATVMPGVDPMTFNPLQN